MRIALICFVFPPHCRAVLLVHPRIHHFAWGALFSFALLTFEASALSRRNAIWAHPGPQPVVRDSPALRGPTCFLIHLLLTHLRVAMDPNRVYCQVRIGFSQSLQLLELAEAEPYRERGGHCRYPCTAV
ncbi:hypothetical protein EXIGLDRAFT_527958 [Exidia glandulosa HHB12029]|uniref:Uncharacterized protein n=1 Tax=Exidia glandulosa HHB12029 TaxID=1314781 RepID=A0A165IYN5_EXIGL|nr:hypothetical protein EXIGLDRAFT_527958 [Exidia glandulosa HHB12029]